MGGRNWLRWAHLWFWDPPGLKARWLASLEFGQKGAFRLWAVHYGLQTVEAVGGLNGPKPHNQRGLGVGEVKDWPIMPVKSGAAQMSSRTNMDQLAIK
ncbi:hypothetical protein O181_126439 [Austropuccinia psidii MF-1]|uniref:Uncharacterized protein n=1 Tax=Austropuccinia psidii MF-1 TaxID=1389203 RepID=A0A9Q3KTC7_9BASI|nr:hypothetical protein [Austropuccinia psidii MF-1]